MKSLSQFDEFGKGMGFPSMTNYFEASPYQGKEAIIEYLNNGKKTFAACSKAKDIFTGEEIQFELCGMTDGEYSWISSLSHYVDKYNLRLIPEFERKVLSIR